jgi:Holliday junction DNA helicase RuvA
MIAKLTGTIDEAGIDTLVIDVGGVGYLVHASSRTIAAVGAVGQLATIFTQMQVSENDQRLVGFASAEERDWYRALTQVQGVGSKVALAILSALEPDDLTLAVAHGDAAMVARANGVGPKLATRIVNELKDKVGGVALGALGGGSAPPAGSLAADAVAALTGLGFKPNEASNAVKAANDELGAGAGLDALVRLALKKAAK